VKIWKFHEEWVLFPLPNRKLQLNNLKQNVSEV
jgi:hypothetical protein